ncbi:MAG: hypothetical protein WEB29_08660 [Chloroflexota bacterium]
MTAMSLFLQEGPVAVSTACQGSGDLVVMLSGLPPSDAQPVVGTSAIFRCDEQTATARVELTDAPSGDVRVSAFVVEGGGTTRHAAYNISVEQPLGTASQ